MFISLKAIVPENTFSHLWDVLLLLDHYFAHLLSPGSQFSKKYNIDMFSSEFNETNFIMYNYGPYTTHSSI